jgi:hypothetical protein
MWARPLQNAANMKFGPVGFTALFLLTVAASLGSSPASADSSSKVAAFKCKVAFKGIKGGRDGKDPQVEVPALQLEKPSHAVVKVVNYDRVRGKAQRKVRLQFDSYFQSNGAGPFVRGVIEHLERDPKGKFLTVGIGEGTSTNFDLSQGDEFQWNARVASNKAPKVLVECNKVYVLASETHASAGAAEADFQ